MNTRTFQLTILIFLCLSSVILAKPKSSHKHEHHDHQHHHHDHDHDHDHEHHDSPSQLLSKPQRFGYGLLAGLAVSLIGFLTALGIVCFKNFTSDDRFQVFIKFLFGLALGALLGDATIHILSEAYTAEGSDSRLVSGILVASLLFFLILERIFTLCGISHQHWIEQGDSHESHCDHPNKIEDKQSSKTDLKQKSSQKTQEITKSPSFWQGLKGKGTAGYMNLVGSLIHNFMDGLAIGAAFATGDKKQYIPVFVAIVAHEIPRQMGDVAILMKNSFNSMQTILCNGIINLISIAGVLIGLLIIDMSELVKVYILVFVAGNFFYIAADIWRHMFRNQGVWRNAIEMTGFALGIGVIYALLFMEGGCGHHGHNHGHGHSQTGKVQSTEQL